MPTASHQRSSNPETDINFDNK
jgi:hypothetical protein